LTYSDEQINWLKISLSPFKSFRADKLTINIQIVKNKWNTDLMK
jgi:hypothetical protein